MQILSNFLIETSRIMLIKSGDGLMDYIMHHITDQNSWHPFPLIHLGIEFPNFSIGPVFFENGLHATMLLIAMLFMIITFTLIYKKKHAHVAPKGLSNLLEVFIVFIRDDICIEHLGKREGKRLAPFFLTLFFFILTLNLMGLIPAFSTATANVNVTAGLAIITLSYMIGLSIRKNGIIGFLKAFVPSGLPIIIVPLIFVLEITGLIIKPFALTLRLFANMLAGHIIILAITGVALSFGIGGLPLLSLALFIYLLEILVAFLQAYIFTLLSAIFIGTLVNPHH